MFPWFFQKILTPASLGLILSKSFCNSHWKKNSSVFFLRIVKKTDFPLMKVINNDDNKHNGSGSNDVNDDKNYGDRCSNYHEA